MNTDVVVDGDADERRRRRPAVWWLGAGVVLVAVIVAAGLLLTTRTDQVTGRGSALETLPSWTPAPGATPTLSSTPTASVDGVDPVDAERRMSPVERVWAEARAGVGAPVLVRSDCLDDLAAEYAAAAAEAGGGGQNPPVPEGSCGAGVKVGYVLGFDESGAGQATAALTVTPDGPSPLAAVDAEEVGYAVVSSQGSTGKVNGFVLAWAVSS